MTAKQLVISTLLRLYPAEWCAEYGPELINMLDRRPLTARIVADVIGNGLLQRVRSADAATWLGLVAMFTITLGLISNIGSSYSGHIWPAVIGDSPITLPRIVVTPLRWGLYDLLLILCGCWTWLRVGGSRYRSGRAALRATFLAGIPVMLLGVLMLFGAMNFVVAATRSGAAIELPGLTYTYFDTFPDQIMHRIQPSVLNVIVAPLFELPKAWLWGMVGGKLGQWISPLVSKHLKPE